VQLLAAARWPVPFTDRVFPQPVELVLVRLNLRQKAKGLAAYGHLDGNRFQLRQVVQIMACDGFK
jgi:hypothetical protein